ncbi:DEAD/DEAH box helicase [Niabella beijingensis]|uniref:DEAD/DEAH box helicase n=1 Tax=Niabella beijingensis TaxID=2872700 RepID=UPI001CBFDD85|nr:DEAD/DEAH box helicase [Niabella beijingensis]MBZ4192535.1 DEAD/DEAH box helicase [Niabella beijingensis]
MSFNNLQLIAPILKALSHEGYTTPTPIQEKSIPVILQKKDLLACAQTGTGKTASFALPLLQLLYGQKQEPSHNPKVLVLVPTRELALQVSESFTAYGRYLPLKQVVIFGGVSQHNQVRALQRSVDVLIATPGRLLDLINQGYPLVEAISYLVLDEADRMLDMGFIHDVKRILARLPQQRQTIFFSATMPPEVQKLSDALLKQPVKIEITPPATTVDKIQQSVYHTEKPNKPALLLHVLQNAGAESTLVFARTKYGADKIAKSLNRSGISAAAIHGNKSQGARQTALGNFKTGKISVLVATDIAARGIDIDGMGYVINYELPNIPETYVHRIGRTGRAGASGIAVSFCDAEEQPYLKDIQKLINKTIPVVKGHPFEPASPQRTESAPSQPAADEKRKQHWKPKKTGHFHNRYKKPGQKTPAMRGDDR